MSDIRVGDKVCIVMICVQKNDLNGFCLARTSSLGREGVVTHINVGRYRPYVVLFPGNLLGDEFNVKELKVLRPTMLKVSREPPKSDDTIGCLRAQVTLQLVENERLHQTNKALRKDNEYWCKEVKGLREKQEVWLQANEKVRQAIVDIVNKGMPVW